MSCTQSDQGKVFLRSQTQWAAKLRKSLKRVNKGLGYIKVLFHFDFMSPSATSRLDLLAFTNAIISNTGFSGDFLRSPTSLSIMTSHPWHQQGFFFHTTAAHWIYFFFVFSYEHLSYKSSSWLWHHEIPSRSAVGETTAPRWKSPMSSWPRLHN